MLRRNDEDFWRFPPPRLSGVRRRSGVVAGFFLAADEARGVGQVLPSFSFRGERAPWDESSGAGLAIVTITGDPFVISFGY